MDLSVRNDTRYPTSALRSIVLRAAKMVEEVTQGDLSFNRNLGWKRRIVFRVVYGRRLRGVTGWCPSIGGDRCVIRVPRGKVSPRSVAWIAAHELGHCAGQSHADMKRYPWSTWRRMGRSFDWADEKQTIVEAPEPVKVRLAGSALAEKRLRAARANLDRWRQKEKRAKTGVRTWARKVRYYERRLAAPAAGQAAGAAGTEEA